MITPQLAMIALRSALIAPQSAMIASQPGNNGRVWQMGRSRPAQPVKRFTAEDAAGHRGGAGRVQRMCGGSDCLGGLAWRGAAGYSGWGRERMLGLGRARTAD